MWNLHVTSYAYNCCMLMQSFVFCPGGQVALNCLFQSQPRSVPETDRAIAVRHCSFEMPSRARVE